VPADLTQFQQTYNLPQTPIAKVVGVNQPSQCAQSGEKGGSVLLSHFDGILQVNNCFEASLDVQYILAIAQNATTWYWSVSSTGDIFLQWIEALASTPNPPLVHSMSYASLAPEDPKYDVERFNTEMCKLGLKGLTLFVASGDDGVANFGARNSPSQCGFTPSFPATSPVSFCKCLLLLLLTRVQVRDVGGRDAGPGSRPARDCLLVRHRRPHHHGRRLQHLREAPRLAGRRRARLSQRPQQRAPALHVLLPGTRLPGSCRHGPQRELPFPFSPFFLSQIFFLPVPHCKKNPV